MKNWIHDLVSTISTRGWNNVPDMTLSILYGKSGLKDMNQLITYQYEADRMNRQWLSLIHIQLLTYSKQAEAGIHQKAIQMLLGAGNNKKQDSLSISDAARGFSKQSIAALIDKNANISNSELAYYFANYNNSSAILDAINFGENVSCGYNSDFKEYGVISFDLNGSRQVVPNYAVPKMNTSTMSGICAANNLSLIHISVSGYPQPAS